MQRTPLGSARLIALCAAAFAPDILDGLLVISGVCNPVGLYTHTVPVVLLQTAVVAGLALIVTNSRRVAVLFAAAVLLHPVADFFTGRKLMMPGGELYGLNLYDRPAIDFMLETTLAVGGWWLIRRAAIAPRWAVSARTLALFVLLQAVIDTYSDSYTRAMKPDLCKAPGVSMHASPSHRRPSAPS